MRTVAASATSRHLLATLALTATLLIAASAGAGDAGEAPALDGGAAVAGASQPGMRVYRDPATGAFIAPPAGATLSAATRALGAAAETLVETPGTSGAGGVMIDLRGSFQSAITATVDDGGRVGTRCRSSADAPR
ncbi:MAG: hypothetical protein HY271_01540 [Deltaproteobacteria bacterium]|nr:hypothetical protein [Deltaproteobacteria bacterium]